MQCFAVIDGQLQRGERVESCDEHTLPAKVEQGIALLPCFNSHTMNRCPPLVCECYVLVFLCFLLVTLLLKMAFRHSAKVLSSVPKVKKSMVCPTEKI